MPKRPDIKRILIIGSGPIVIGQACEFEYSGTQACKALKADGYEVVLVNSNPASIMTDPEFSDRTYIEPLTLSYVEEIIRVESAMLGPGCGKFALLPTVGGQTALNLAVDLSDAGILDKYGVEVMRDLADNVIIICSIENFYPMGVHTGDSITVAPAQTLTDREYQKMRDAAIAVMREIGVETGGSNVQFAVNPANGRMTVIEMTPRISLSSALASKATGFPIAKIAAKLAVGYTLDEIRNDITRETPASFEPSIDYVVVKIPRFAFEKFPATEKSLSTQMKSVGEVMSIGRTFKEALQKAVRSLEQDRWGLTLDRPVTDLDELRQKIRIPNADRCFALGEAYRRGLGIREIHEL